MDASGSSSSSLAAMEETSVSDEDPEPHLACTQLAITVMNYL